LFWVLAGAVKLKRNYRPNKIIQNALQAAIQLGVLPTYRCWS
jgi:hypothetical protein